MRSRSRRHIAARTRKRPSPAIPVTSAEAARLMTAVAIILMAYAAGALSPSAIVAWP